MNEWWPCKASDVQFAYTAVGVGQLDISGELYEDATWSGHVRINGDLTVPYGVRLTIAEGTEVHFLADTDETVSGADLTRSELIVENGGVLHATDITFRSANTNPLPLEWYGLRVASGGRATLTDVTVRDGVHCVQADPGGSLVLENLTLINCGTPPTIEGDSMPEFPEDSTEPVAAYTAEDAEGDAVAWSLGTAAAEAAFTLTSEGVLDFEEPPDFETLNGDSLFSVTVRATDRQQAFTDYPVTVTVRNVDEAGTVVLSPLPPEVDGELTATLADVDGVLPETTAWIWSAESADGTSTIVREEFGGVATESGGATDRYTPQSSDVGRRLQVRVDYADGHGPGKSEVSVPTAAVVGPELVGPESLTFVEHGTFVEDGEAVVPTYMVSGVDGPVTWSLDGLDAASFELAAASSQASLSFSSPPNYEVPTDTDQGGPNTYHVTVVATLTDGAAEAAENPLADMMAAFAALSDDSPSAQASSSALTLLERTADGEQALFRFDEGDEYGRSHYDVTIQGQTIQVIAWETRANSRHEYSFRFSGGAGAVRVYDADAVDYYDLDAGRELDEVRVELRAGIAFLKGFGVRACGVGINDGDAPLFTNGQTAKHAVLDGRTVTVREAQEASVTTIEGDSWGEIKQEEHP